MHEDEDIDEGYEILYSHYPADYETKDALLAPTVHEQECAEILSRFVMPVLARLPGRINHETCGQGEIYAGRRTYLSCWATIEMEDGAMFRISVRPGWTTPDTNVPAGTAMDQRASYLLRGFIQPPIERLLQTERGQTGPIDVDRSLMRSTIRGRNFTAAIQPAT